jgi:hypothetical protein
MVRGVLTPQAVAGSVFTVIPTLTFTALDNVNGMEVVASGNDLVLIHNTTGGAVVFTMKSSADPFGRVGDITKSVPASGFALVGPLGATGWRQTNGRLWFDAAATGLELAVIQL